MQVTLARHTVTEICFGPQTRVDDTVLFVDAAALRRLVLEDPALAAVDFDIVRPGDSCRAGPIFDIVQPRAKAPGSGPDFPGILGAPTTAGMGTTHVLAGSAVTILAEMSPGEGRSATGRVLEMSGAVVSASDYSFLQHLLIIPHTKPGLPRAVVLKAYRLAALNVAVQVARCAIDQASASIESFPAIGPSLQDRNDLSRVAYIGQIFSRQRKPGVDEPILYGANTDGMLPVMLHPDEWLDGAIVPSLNSWFGGTETYFYQNNPIVLD